MPAQMSTSLDHGSKLHGPSPKALVQLNSGTLIFTHSLTRTLGRGLGSSTLAGMSVSLASSQASQSISLKAVSDLRSLKKSLHFFKSLIADGKP
ncbi:hypothetical protein TNCV_1594411 [Trichonephila clavipes]|nr:hypothetical protein TNCV_1594411 [Trichonephila clavipes]